MPKVMILATTLALAAHALAESRFGPQRSAREAHNLTTNGTVPNGTVPNGTAVAECPDRTYTAMSLVKKNENGDLLEEKHFDFVQYAGEESIGTSDTSEGHPMQLFSYEGCPYTANGNGTVSPIPVNMKDPKTVLVLEISKDTSICDSTFSNVVYTVALSASQQGYAGLVVLRKETRIRGGEIAGDHSQISWQLPICKLDNCDEITAKIVVLDYYESQTVLTALRPQGVCKGDKDAQLAATADQIGQSDIKSCDMAAQNRFCEDSVYGPTVKGLCPCACNRFLAGPAGTTTVSFGCKSGWNVPALPFCTPADIDASVAKMSPECENTTRTATALFATKEAQGKGYRRSRTAACGCIAKAHKAGAVLPRNCVLDSDQSFNRQVEKYHRVTAFEGRNTLVGWRDFCTTEYDECPKDDTQGVIDYAKSVYLPKTYLPTTCYEAVEHCGNPVLGPIVKKLCPCACDKFCEEIRTDVFAHAATEYFGVGANETNCEAIAAKSPELCDGKPLENGVENLLPNFCPCTCDKVAGKKSCADDDKTLAETAAKIGQSDIKSCAMAAQYGFCEHAAYGPTVKGLCCQSCPKPCKDDDKTLAETAAKIGQSDIKSCAMAAQYGFCEHAAYGSTVKGLCPCACAPAQTTEAPFGEVIAPTDATANATAAPTNATVTVTVKTVTVTVTFSIPGNFADMNSTEIQNAQNNIAETFVTQDILRADITVTLSAAQKRRADTILVTVTIKTTAGAFSAEAFEADMKANGREFTYTIKGQRKTETVKEFTADVVETVVSTVSPVSVETPTPSAAATQLSSLTAVFFVAVSAMQFC